MTKRYKYLFGGLLLACLFTLSGCSHEMSIGGSEDDPGQPVALRLQIGTESGASALPLTKASRDMKAKDHEFINSLVVLITNTDNRIEKVVPFEFTSEQMEEMAEGKLESCISDEFILTTGTKIIYAFANCEGLLFDDVLKATSGTQLQLPLTVTWDKGQEWIPNDNKGFIPMTAKKEVTIGRNTKEVSIELVRLLSRLEVSFCNSTDADIEILSWSIGMFNQKINLFGGEAIPNVGNDSNWNISDNTEKTVSASSAIEAVSYYVSESAMAGGFSVDINRGTGTETKYTSRTEIPRNHIWPLEILFSDYQLKIQIKGENPPIGGYPEEVTSDLTGSTECFIKGGGPFTLTPKLYKKDGTTKVEGVTWSIDTSGLASELVKDLSSTDGQTITGIMAGAAEADDTYTFTLKATISGGAATSFPVTLKFKDILAK